MTKEGVVVISILTVLILVAIIIPADESSESQARLTESAAMMIAEKETENTNFIEAKSNSGEVKGLKVAKEDIEIRDPFTFSHEARGEAPKIQDTDIKKENAKPKNIKNEKGEKNVKTKTKSSKLKSNKKSETKTDPPPAKWELRGIIDAGDNKTAILSFGDDNKILKIGDSFDNKKIIAIGEDYIICSGINGEERLNLSMP